MDFLYTLQPMCKLFSKCFTNSFMDELDDLGTYNGDTEHNMWVDFTYNENTGELHEEFGDEDLDEFIDNHNDMD